MMSLRREESLLACDIYFWVGLVGICCTTKKTKIHRSRFHDFRSTAAVRLPENVLSSNFLVVSLALFFFVYTHEVTLIFHTRANFCTIFCTFSTTNYEDEKNLFSKKFRLF